MLELEFSEWGNRYDGNRPYPHPHVICTRCGAIADSERIDLDAFASRMAGDTGYRIDAHRLDFYGLCPACQQQA